MSNDRKHTNDPNDEEIKDKSPHPGQSQDASRHKQDAAHHKGYKGPQPSDASDSDGQSPGPKSKSN
jgi:hypothetical protein